MTDHLISCLHFFILCSGYYCGGRAHSLLLLSLKRNCCCCCCIASQEEEETFSLVERENGGDTWKSDGVEMSQKGTNKTIKIRDGRGEIVIVCVCNGDDDDGGRAGLPVVHDVPFY